MAVCSVKFSKKWDIKIPDILKITFQKYTPTGVGFKIFEDGQIMQTTIYSPLLKKRHVKSAFPFDTEILRSMTELCKTGLFEVSMISAESNVCSFLLRKVKKIILPAYEHDTYIL